MAAKEHDRAPQDAEPLIADRFLIDFARPLTGAGAGLAAFAARDRRTDRCDAMALQVLPDAPPRAQLIMALTSNPSDGVLAPLAHGAARTPNGRAALFVIGQAPPGPSLAADPPKAWSETDLLALLLRPAAAALDGLHMRRLTHRAVRPDNLFRSGPGAPVILGSFWAAPPASRQSALFEPPYVAMCRPEGRGDGTIADAVYALGVTLLVLAMGQMPLSNLDDNVIIQRKIELGSFQALAGDARLPPVIADLIRGMLAEDPEHRPPPSLLCDPAAARARRVAARPPRRAQAALQIGARTVWDARTLAFALASEPELGVALLRGDAVAPWLRRRVGDIGLATRLAETVPLRGNGKSDDPLADAMVAMRAIAVLDPLAPLCWRGLAFWPDGIGPLLAASDSDNRIDEVVEFEAMTIWAATRPERCDATGIRLDARLHRALYRIGGWCGGKPRLRYALNPLLACASGLVDGQVVVRLADLLAAFDAVVRPERAGNMLIDREMAAFIAARHDQPIEAELGALALSQDEAAGALKLLRLFAALQDRFAMQRPIPRLAGCLARVAGPALATWHNRDRRGRIAAAMTEVAATGRLSAMVALLDDPMAREADAREAEAATQSIARIDAELSRIASGAAARASVAQRIGTEIAAASGAVALAAAIMIAMFSG